jgi:microcystin degradation protein MlrC
MADYRVLAACIMHETNTFSRQQTDLAAFRRRDFHIGREIPALYRGTRSAMGATFEAAERFGWIVAHPVCAAANPSGPVTRHAFETLMDLLLGCAQEQAPIDGALLHLHGAMVTQDHEDGDGELLARLRQVLGAEAPIVATLDLHANVTSAMVENANALIAFRTSPHVDMYERAWQGAELLERAMRRELRPKTVLARRPMMAGLDYGRTQSGPMAELLRRADEIERRGDALVVSICAGFTRANIRDVGPSVTVTGQDDDARCQAIAESFMDYAWETRACSTSTELAIPEAIALAKQGRPGDKPLILADYTDNPGSGGYGDATALLAALLEAGVSSVAFHAICDPAAVQDGMAAGIGRTATIVLGGKVDPSVGGGPLFLTGEIVCLTNGRFIAYGPMGGGVARDYGPSMVFHVRGIDIIVITNNGQANDTAQFTSLGIDPARYQTVVVKSYHHFRAAFEALARGVVLVDTGALCADVYSPELFSKVRRPVWPLDDIA